MTDPARKTSAEVRADIDAGRTGERSGGLDPAAAPLATDAEAAGAPPSSRQTDRAEPPARPSARKNAAEPELAPDARMSASGPITAGLAIGAGAAVVFSGLLWLVVR